MNNLTTSNDIRKALWSIKNIDSNGNINGKYTFCQWNGHENIYVQSFFIDSVEEGETIEYEYEK